MLWFFVDYDWVILNLQHFESCKLETIYILSVDWLQSLNELCITDVWAMFSKFILDFCLRTNKVLSWGERGYLFEKKKVVVENGDCEKECWKIWHNQKQSMKLQRKKERKKEKNVAYKKNHHKWKKWKIKENE